MIRRSFVASLMALVGASTVSVEAKPKRFGRLTTEGFWLHKRLTGEDLHVYLNGLEVTSQWFAADDVDGFVDVWCLDAREHAELDAQGAVHLGVSGRHACAMRVRGTVVIRPVIARPDQSVP